MIRFNNKECGSDEFDNPTWMIAERLLRWLWIFIQFTAIH